MEFALDVRARTMLVCGALALAIAASAVLRTKASRAHVLFALTATNIGLFYLSQSLFSLSQSAIWERLRVALAVLLPVLASNLFEAMVPGEGEDGQRSRVGRLSILVAVPVGLLALSPYMEHALARVSIFLFTASTIGAGLYEMAQRGRRSRSRATRRRVRFLAGVGACAGLFTVTDFAWVIGYRPAYHPPPVGAVLSLIFLFILAQALRHERLLDLYEMLGRLVVASAVAFLIAGLFYVMLAVIGQFNTVWVNAILVAIVVLVIFNPLRDWVELQIQRFVLRERGRLQVALLQARRRLTHTFEVDEMARIVMRALERSRAVTTAALYLLVDDGSVLEALARHGPRAPESIDALTARALLEQLAHGTVVLEQWARDKREGRSGPRRHLPVESVLIAAEVLAPMHETAVVLPIRGEEGELVGLLIVEDTRIGDAFSPEDVGLLEGMASQVGVVVENSRLYGRMKERDRLAVLGQLAAGLAHEIRNPLGAIKGAAQLLDDPGPDQAPLDASSKEYLGIILEEVDRLDGVVGSVLDLARQSPSTVVPIDVNAVVRRTLQVVRADWTERALRVEADLEEELPRVAMAPEQLRQVLMNLLRNAADAVSETGGIRVRSRSRSNKNERFVVISVEDDGPGIAAAALKNIFLPFYTTKSSGTGLGLAICQRIVQESGGRIELRSREGRGTTVDLVFEEAMQALGTPSPSAAKVLQAQERPPPAAGPTGARSSEADASEADASQADASQADASQADASQADAPKPPSEAAAEAAAEAEVSLPPDRIR